MRHLLFSPGFLTQEYLRGRRSRYTRPLRLYLLISALAIGAMSFFDAFSLDAWTQGAEDPLRPFGIENAADPDFRARFDQRINLVFPVVNLLSPFLFCLLLKVLYRRQFIETHLVFSLHYFAFFVLIGLAPLPALRVGTTATVLTFVGVVSALMLYLAVAQKRVYGGSWGRLLPRLFVLLLGIAFLSQALGVLTVVVTAATV